MADGDEPQPDMRTNLLKIRKNGAGARTEAAPGNLTFGGGNPLAGALSGLQEAWVSPSWARTVFAEADSCRAEAGVEPVEVDLDGPQGWKASRSRIGARVTASEYYPGRPR